MRSQEGQQADVADCEPNPAEVRKLLYEPIAPYFTNTYNTLISVVQGIALASLFFVIQGAIDESGLSGFPILGIWKILIAFCFASLVWHRYVVHDQYLVWPLDIVDTLIPMGFAVLQMILMLYIFRETFVFSGVLGLLCFLGAIAYKNADIKHARPRTFKIYKNHFESQPDEFVETLLSAIGRFERRQAWEFFLAGVIFFGVAIAGSWRDNPRDLEIVFVVLALLFIGWTYRCDLRCELKRYRPLMGYLCEEKKEIEERA
ncbi:hypothetical protein [Thiococcus pfennigii]|uniref:hypothetical protein n=1 Tax=Thiococcus pfennigii TaxID=1057 RepID=UPI001906E37F|nr:hypothetical protein [Thiococcus pfennigii]